MFVLIRFHLNLLEKFKRSFLRFPDLSFFYFYLFFMTQFIFSWKYIFLLEDSPEIQAQTCYFSQPVDVPCLFWTITVYTFC